MLKACTQVIRIPITRGLALPSSVLQSKYHRETPRRYSSDTEAAYNLTKHEVLTYLENVLGIPDPVSFANKNKVAFIQEMMRQTNLKIPFTGIMALSFRKDGIEGTSLNEIKQALFKRQGGHCMAINTFTSAVLQYMGFETYLIGASVHRWKVPLYDSHFTVITKHLTAPNSLHLVDVGSQYFLPLISLDFDRISQVYYSRGFQYRFFQVSPGVVQLTRKCKPPKPGRGDGLIYTENEDFWEVLTTFRISIPLQLKECHYLSSVICKNPKLIPGATDGFWVYSLPNNLSVRITDSHCVTATEIGYTHVTKLESSTQVINTILKYFPQYPRNQLEKMADFFAKASHKKHILNISDILQH